MATFDISKILDKAIYATNPVTGYWDGIPDSKGNSIVDGQFTQLDTISFNPDDLIGTVKAYISIGNQIWFEIPVALTDQSQVQVQGMGTTAHTHFYVAYNVNDLHLDPSDLNNIVQSGKSFSDTYVKPYIGPVLALVALGIGAKIYVASRKGKQ